MVATQMGDDEFDDASLDAYICDADFDQYDVLVQCEDQPTQDNKPVPSEAEECDSAYSSTLKSSFGHSTFRSVQWNVIKTAMIERRDQCIVMATGAGKSLCYQFPAVHLKKTAVVISPLISLMEDQVANLKSAGITAAFLGSAQTDNAKIIQQAKQNQYRILYVTPEFVGNHHDTIKAFYNMDIICLFAIDEAHCVSQWGHDFRSSYRNLGQLRQIAPNVPIMALTATATRYVIDDIVSSLNLRNAKVTCTTFDRPNLYIEVKNKGESPSQDILPLLRIKSADYIKRMEQKRRNPSYIPCGGLGSVVKEAVIIYCQSKRETDSLAAELSAFGVKASSYHSGKSVSERREVHQQFIRDEVQVICATIAFGMGIDKREIGKYIHYGTSASMEAYYQEIGRAGRDGQLSTCHVFYKSTDFQFWRNLRSQNAHPADGTAQSKQLTETSKKIEEYIVGSQCRRLSILRHFGETYQQSNCTMCDRCLLTVKHQVVDMGSDARLLAEAVLLTEGRFGLGVPVRVLLGKEDQRLQSRVKNASLFGKGKHHSEKWWMAFGHALQMKGLLESVIVKGQMYSTVRITNTGRNAVNQGESYQLMMEPTMEMTKNERHTAPRPSLSMTKSTQVLAKTSSIQNGLTSTETSDDSALQEIESDLKNKLYDILNTLRTGLARSLNCAPYMILTEDPMRRLCDVRPSTLESMEFVDGINSHKISEFGPQFIEAIVRFCNQNNWETDIQPKVTRRGKLSPAAEHACDLFKQGLDPKQIATMRKIKVETLGNYLLEGFQRNVISDFARAGLDDKTYKEICMIYDSPPENVDITRLKPVKELLPEEVTWTAIKLAKVRREQEIEAGTYIAAKDRVEAPPKLIKSYSFPSRDTTAGSPPSLVRTASYTPDAMPKKKRKL